MYLHLEVLAGTQGYLKDGGPLRATSMFIFSFRTSAQHSRPGGEPWWASQISQGGGGDSYLRNFMGCHGNCMFSPLPTGLLGGMLLNSVSPHHPPSPPSPHPCCHSCVPLPGSDPRPRSAEWAPRQTVKSEVEWKEGSHQMVQNMTETEIESLTQTGCLGGRWAQEEIRKTCPTWVRGFLMDAGRLRCGWPLPLDGKFQEGE